jgi:chromosome segregation ATPase
MYFSKTLDNPSSNWYNTTMSDEEREYLNETIRNLNNQLVDALRERDEMQGELRKAETECSMLRVECGVIAAERDDARKEYCMAQSHVDEEYGKTTLPEEIAEERGWDCFNKNPTGNA